MSAEQENPQKNIEANILDSNFDDRLKNFNSILEVYHSLQKEVEDLESKNEALQLGIQVEETLRNERKKTVQSVEELQLLIQKTNEALENDQTLKLARAKIQRLKNLIKTLGNEIDSLKQTHLKELCGFQEDKVQQGVLNEKKPTIDEVVTELSVGIVDLQLQIKKQQKHFSGPFKTYEELVEGYKDKNMILERNIAHIKKENEMLRQRIQILQKTRKSNQSECTKTNDSKPKVVKCKKSKSK